MQKCEADMLERRLRNWGRWNRDPKRQGRSSICKIIESNPDNIPKREPMEPIDIEDALTVQRAWQRLPVSPERYRKAKHLIGVAYAYPVPFLEMKRILRKGHRINIHEREFEPLLATAETMMANILQRLDSEEKVC